MLESDTVRDGEEGGGGGGGWASSNFVILSEIDLGTVTVPCGRLGSLNLTYHDVQQVL